jgi:hypothetical protein
MPRPVAGKGSACYIAAMSPSTKKLLEQVESWPAEDQEELAEYAREIEARRTGVYRATTDELQAIDEAERSGVATHDEVEAAFLTFRRR